MRLCYAMVHIRTQNGLAAWPDAVTVLTGMLTGIGAANRNGPEENSEDGESGHGS